MSYGIYPLRTAKDPTLFGGKAASLHRLIIEGYNVPDGFVVVPDDSMTIDEKTKRDILEQFDVLGAKYVAVRSSALHEDGVDASWAGQLATYLYCTRATVVDSVNSCKSSNTSVRAKAYANQKGVEISKVSVLVQKMINCEVSGVAFSIHPVTNDASQVVIEAVLGLGEALVSGQVTPDMYVVAKENNAILNKFVAHQEKMMVRDTNKGSTRWVDTGAAGATQKLLDTHTTQIAELTQQLSVMYGFAVDVEWGIENSEVYVLQCRPVTTAA